VITVVNNITTQMPVPVHCRSEPANPVNPENPAPTNQKNHLNQEKDSNLFSHTGQFKIQNFHVLLCNNFTENGCIKSLFY
jgi:hypothetical protein